MFEVACNFQSNVRKMPNLGTKFNVEISIWTSTHEYDKLLSTEHPYSTVKQILHVYGGVGVHCNDGLALFTYQYTHSHIATHL